MSLFSLNTNCANESNANVDILAAFRNHDEKESTIRQGMSINEISDVVSDRLMEIIKNQLPKEKKVKRQKK